MQLRQKALALLDRVRVKARLGMDQIQAEVSQEELLGEARQLPLGFTRGFGDLARLPL